MGLLKDFGALLTYDQAKDLQQKLKNTAALQLLNLIQKYQDWEKQPGPCCKFLWGEEIEGHRFVFNAAKQRFQLYQGQLPKLNFQIVPEYGRWMFEMIPDQPYNTECNLLEVVISLKARYEAIHKLDQVFLTIPSVPFLGTTYVKQLKAEGKFDNTFTHSQFIDDTHITDHPRFRALTKNIRERSGATVHIKVPIFPDKNTNLKDKTEDEPFPGLIYMDAMAFGMGMACLQCTFSTKNIFQARRIHDQLHVLSPLFLALSAGTPIFKGKLANIDVRWFPLGDSVDDRTQQELNPLSPHYQLKSRYSSLSYFISDSNQNLLQYNDIKYQVNEEVIKLLKDKAYERKIWMDEKLITHMGILASRDFIVVHQNFPQIEETEYYLFEMLNSTNWNSVRFKIPIDDNIGWRVQFRTLEVQLTAEENSLFSILIFSLVRIISKFPKVNFYIPISLIDINFERAHKPNAILLEKFYFRINIYEDGEPIIKELTLFEIFFGCEKEAFIGIVGMFRTSIEDGKLCEFSKEQAPNFVQVFEKIFVFLRKRLTGETITLAQWMRKFVQNHKSYKHDSIVTDEISRDLIFELDKISKGEIKDTNFAPIF